MFKNNSYPLIGAIIGQGWVEVQDGVVLGYYTFRQHIVHLDQYSTLADLKNDLLSRGLGDPAYSEAIATYNSFQTFIQTIDQDTPEGTHLDQISVIAGKPVYEESLDRTLADTLSLIDNTVKSNGVLPQIDSYIELIKVGLHYRTFQKMTQASEQEDITI